VRNDPDDGLEPPMKTADDLRAAPTPASRTHSTPIVPPDPESLDAAYAPVPEEQREIVFSASDLGVTYSGAIAIEDVNLDIGANEITALIGPSGCGKSTFIRCLDRMNDLILGAKVHGTLLYHGTDLYGPKVDPVEVRRRIGMVFQKPNPFPKSIFDNIAFGPRLNGKKRGHDDGDRAPAPHADGPARQHGLCGGVAKRAS
jgi:phosphate transport system ATP-binding protein